MRTRILCLAFATGLWAQDAPAQPQASQPFKARLARRQEKVAQALGLSEAQREQIKLIRGRHKDAIQSKRDVARDAHRQLAQAMKDPKASEADLRRLNAQAADRRFDLLLEERSMRSEMQAILTPEQREKAAEFWGRLADRPRRMRD